MKNKNTGGSTLLWVFVFITGLSLLLYPSFSNYVNQLHSSQTVSNYSTAIADLTRSRYEEIWEEARTYNEGISGRENIFHMSVEEQEAYAGNLNVSGDGVMGYIEIPSIEVLLPICHGTEDRVLQTSIGHIEWTSLPVGGAGCHTVLSGHRGLPSAKLFTHLDQLATGDIFMLRVLNEVLTYEVDQILIVKPEDSSALKPVKGMDYCTLVTCTPYGINSHRLLVRGHRIRNAEVASAMRITGEGIQINPPLVAPFLAVPLLGLFLIALFAFEPRRPHASDNSIFEELDDLELDYLDINYDMNDLRRLAAMEPQMGRRGLRRRRRRSNPPPEKRKERNTPPGSAENAAEKPDSREPS